MYSDSSWSSRHWKETRTSFRQLSTEYQNLKVHQSNHHRENDDTSRIGIVGAGDVVVGRGEAENNAVNDGLVEYLAKCGGDLQSELDRELRTSRGNQWYVQSRSQRNDGNSCGDENLRLGVEIHAAVRKWGDFRRGVVGESKDVGGGTGVVGRN